MREMKIGRKYEPCPVVEIKKNKSKGYVFAPNRHSLYLVQWPKDVKFKELVGNYRVIDYVSNIENI